MSAIFITITRPGKQPVTVEGSPGMTVRDALVKAGISAEDYADWHITGEDGVTLTLDSTLSASTALICGGRMAGAV